MPEKLILQAFSDPDMSDEVGVFTVQINPDSLKESFSNSFAPDKAIETGGQRLNYLSRDPGKVTFSIVLDSTGVVPGVPNVDAAIEDFEKVAFAFNGEAHSPNYLLLVWGDLIFPCRLTDVAIAHELFSPSGASLRAKLDVSLSEHRTAKQIIARAGKKSNDLSKSRRVVDGKTLPMMCQDVYNDPSLLVALARANDLDDLMHLPPGTVLDFPPVRG